MSEQPNGRDLECYACGALRGQPCIKPSGKPATQDHAWRPFGKRPQRKLRSADS